MFFAKKIWSRQPLRFPCPFTGGAAAVYTFPTVSVTLNTFTAWEFQSSAIMMRFPTALLELNEARAPVLLIVSAKLLCTYLILVTDGDTVNDKLSATVACTVTPELIETSILPDPPNVPPTEIV